MTQVKNYLGTTERNLPFKFEVIFCVHGVVSPILANVYLHYALDLWFEKGVRKQVGGEAMMCRYADDFVCAFRYQEDAESFYQALPERLGKFGLKVASEKTQILRFVIVYPPLIFDYPPITRRRVREGLGYPCGARR